VIEVGLSLSLTREQGKRLSLWPEKQKAELIRIAVELKLRFGYQPIKRSRAVNPQPILPQRRFTLSDVLE